MATGPTGTVTFLFTDIEGSTRLWEADAQAMGDALARHDTILRSTIAQHNGHVFATGGDGFAAAFATAAEALSAAAAAQQRLRADALPPVRMGVHTGEAVERDGDYFGPTVNRTARLMAIGHGGQVLVSQATERVASGVELRDLGAHRLRDLSQPERVFQLCVPGVENDDASLASLDSLPTNLPVQLTTFIGREDECKHVTRLVSENRLVTITGVGGVGKTRLALQVAAELLDEFSDGAWLSELAQAEADDALADVVAVALRAPSRSGVSLLDSIVEFLQPRELLLVVDNCEHLLTSASDLIERVLRACPRVRVLATSREGLGIPGEQLWPLRSLSMPVASEGAAGIVESDAVRLFLDRASSVDPTFTLDGTNSAAVADICRRLDGIPLAIELAAARIGSMGPADIAALLDERFRLLTGGRRRAIERHHTLRAAVDWSYQLLGEADRVVFDRIGVFVGSFDAASAQSIAAGGEIETFDVLDALSELVAKSMVGVDHVGGHTRYQLLETLRQYALEQLDARGETDEFRRRHAEYYAGVASKLGPALLGPDEIAVRSLLLADLDNLRAAVGWAIEGPTAAERDLAVRIVGHLARETVLSRASGIGSWAERVLDGMPSSDNRLWFAVMTAATYSVYHRGELARASELADAAATASRHADIDTAVWATMARSNIAASFGDLAGCIAILEEILTWMPEQSIYDDRIIHSILALYLKLAGLDERAEELARGGVERSRMGGQPSSLALALYAHAMSVVDTDTPLARRECEESVALTERGASDVVYANCYALLARLAEADGEHDEAARLVIRAIEYADSVGDRPPMIDSMVTSARLLMKGGALTAFVTVSGGIQEGWFAPMARIVRPQEDISSSLVGTRAELGEGVYRTARGLGAAMTYDELIAYTLGELHQLCRV